MYRSLLDADWTKDVYKLAAWTRLILRARSSNATISFNGELWQLELGQLVIIPSRFANELRDRKGNQVTRDSVIRLLKFFKAEA